MSNNPRYQPQRWTLKALLPAAQGPELENALADFEQAVRGVEAWRPRLKPDISEEDFLASLSAYETAGYQERRLDSYADLWHSEDTQSQSALAFKSRIEDIVAAARNRMLFFSLWWKSLDDANASRLMRIAGDLRYFLEAHRHFKPYTLSEAEEKNHHFERRQRCTGPSHALQHYHE